jgi:hypothetical protein
VGVHVQRERDGNDDPEDPGTGTLSSAASTFDEVAIFSDVLLRRLRRAPPGTLPRTRSN